MSPSVPWVGRYLRVNGDRSIEWVRCAHCGRALTDRASRRRGVGPICQRDVEPEQLRIDREVALAEDRMRWRTGMPGTVDPVEMRAIEAQARDARRRRALMERGVETDDDRQRWAALQAALGRRVGR